MSPAFPLILAAAISSAGCGTRGKADIDFSIALDDLTRVPARISQRPRGISGMQSTFDRTGGNMDWGNWNSMWIGDKDYLLADLKGPGCVRRLWMTNVQGEEWRFYFDDETTPRIAVAETNLFCINSEGQLPFTRPLSDWISGGCFSYVPLPYGKRLRIVVRNPQNPPSARPYFQINYETYPAGTRVESFPRRLGERERNALDRISRQWRDTEASMRATLENLEFSTAALAPGAELPILDTTGTGRTVEVMAIKPVPGESMDPVERARLLRQLVLYARWDGAQEPSLEVPLGDFFCNGLHQRRFASLVLGNMDGVFTSLLPMPFRQAAYIAIRNESRHEIRLSTAIRLSGTVPPDDMLYLHASWRETTESRRHFNFMQTRGKGNFIGTYLVSLGMEQGWNILEGDELFLRDGGSAPVHHGTGLEDYFNGGWYYYGLFEQPLHGLTEKAAMRTAQYRLQIPDPVTFESSLDAFIEFGHGNHSKGYMSAASYWYQDKPGPSGSKLPPPGQRFPKLEQTGVSAIMCEIFELERMGLDLEAEERSAYYSAMFRNQPLGTVFELRRLAYREIIEGPDSVREAYRSIAENPDTHPEAAEQAKLLLWRTEKPFRALFGGTGYSELRLFVDGKMVGTCDNPVVYKAFPVQLDPGVHFLQVEVTSKGDHSWYTFGFASDFTNLTNDVSWDYCFERPGQWPESAGAGESWKPYPGNLGFFPTMQWWQFMPNAYPMVQSGQQIGCPVHAWEKPAGRKLYLRRRITVPDSVDVRHNPFKRNYMFHTDPVRPPHDTSNEHLGK